MAPAGATTNPALGANRALRDFEASPVTNARLHETRTVSLIF